MWAPGCSTALGSTGFRLQGFRVQGSRVRVLGFWVVGLLVEMTPARTLPVPSKKGYMVPNNGYSGYMEGLRDLGSRGSEFRGLGFRGLVLWGLDWRFWPRLSRVG